MDLNVSVVLPAAGCGERMNTSTPKQFCKIRGKTIISYTIEAFLRIPWLQNIIVTTSADRHQTLSDLYKHEDRVKVTAGSSSRHRSIMNGIKALTQVQPACDIVVIHDGVRPLIKEDLLKDIVLAADEHGAAGVVRPLVSTVVGVDEDGFLVKSLPRSEYRASEMPQAFRYHVIHTAYEQCSDYDLDYGTECLHLAQKYVGSKVKLLDGPDYLWKLTYKKDLYAFEGVIKEKEDITVCFVGFEEVPSLFHFISQSLSDNGIKCTEAFTSEVFSVIIHISGLETPSLWVTKCDSYQSQDSLQCLICILTVCNGEIYKELEDKFRSLVKQLRSDAGKNVFGVVHVVGKVFKSEKLVDILQYLVRENNPVLSGQIFSISDM